MVVAVAVVHMGCNAGFVVGMSSGFVAGMSSGNVVVDGMGNDMLFLGILLADCKGYCLSLIHI